MRILSPPSVIQFGLTLFALLCLSVGFSEANGHGGAARRQARQSAGCSTMTTTSYSVQTQAPKVVIVQPPPLIVQTRTSMFVGTSVRSSRPARAKLFHGCKG